VRLSRCEVRDHIDYRKNDRWRSYRFYSALQPLKSPMRYICEIFGAPRFSSFSTQSEAKPTPGVGHIIPEFISVRPSHLERKFVTLYDSSNLYRGERLWRMQV
jgi:hypothetical protein